MKTLLMTVAVLALGLSACGGAGPQVHDARVGEPAGPNTALYFTVTPGGESDRLLDADTEVASDVEFHTTVTDDDGTVSMRPVDEFEVPADGRLVLEPGGLHVMLVDVERLEVGEIVEVVLTWENAGEMTIEADVVSPADTMSGAQIVDGYGATMPVLPLEESEVDGLVEWVESLG